MLLFSEYVEIMFLLPQVLEMDHIELGFQHRGCEPIRGPEMDVMREINYIRSSK